MAAATLAAALAAVPALGEAAWAGPRDLAQTHGAGPTRISAFGDSLSAGYQLPADAAFPAVLERALRQDGFDVRVDNAAVSGDTTQGGVERLDWSVPDGTDLAIVELGANDMLRGIDPAVTAKNLDTIVDGLQKRHIKVLLAGMYASVELDKAYRERFAALYPALAKSRGVPLYPFFLGGIIGHPELHLADGMHPNAAGVAVMVRAILPTVEEVLKGMGVQPSGVKG
jgi:acyl-CoA thioesterase-1